MLPQGWELPSWQERDLIEENQSDSSPTEFERLERRRCDFKRRMESIREDYGLSTLSPVLRTAQYKEYVLEDNDFNYDLWNSEADHLWRFEQPFTRQEIIKACRELKPNEPRSPFVKDEVSLSKFVPQIEEADVEERLELITPLIVDPKEKDAFIAKVRKTVDDENQRRLNRQAPLIPNVPQLLELSYWLLWKSVKGRCCQYQNWCAMEGKESTALRMRTYVHKDHICVFRITWI